MNKLISKGIWIPNNEEKKYNSIIIFDWDDTLLPTTFLESKGIFESVIEFTKFEKQKLTEIEDIILQLLTLAVDKGDVYIITNADKGWVEYSSRIFYPSLSYILKKIKIISAKSKFQEKFPDRAVDLEAFLYTALPAFDIVSTPEEIVEAESKIRDPKDRPILRAALNAGADLFLTGDKDFLESSVEDPRIIRVPAFLDL